MIFSDRISSTSYEFNLSIISFMFNAVIINACMHELMLNVNMRIQNKSRVFENNEKKCEINV